jgi:hypothetical protein
MAGLLAIAFITGGCLGSMLTTTWEINRMARESERRTAEAMAQMASRPTLHQRLDAIDQRLQALDQRLNH